MLKRVTNIRTTLLMAIIGLLAAILWLGAVAVHDNKTSGGKIFIRQFEYSVDYVADIDYSRTNPYGPVGYTVIFKTCGPIHGLIENVSPDDPRVIAYSARVFAQVERLSEFPGYRFHYYLPFDERPEGTSTRTDYSPISRSTSGTPWHCKINPTGVWAASKNLFASLI